MTILDKIIAQKRIEVAERKAILSISELEKKDFFERKCLSLKKSLLFSTSGIISEFKRKSPSKGWIHQNADVCEITAAYSRNGAAGISILTDYEFFGGTPDDLISARSNIAVPVLRKDFMIDEYQLFEAKSYGADVILLIAAALGIEECRTLAKRAHELGLETLLEVHNAEELGHINEHIDMVGVNNRNLKTFEVSTAVSFELAAKIPDDFVKISESGISAVETVRELRRAGFRGFLMGENFMKEEYPAEALKRFISLLNPPQGDFANDRQAVPPEGGFRGAVKVCGMKNPQNIQDLAALNPDFIGFIFYEKSPRFCGKELQNLDFIPKNIEKIGVFVNEDVDVILDIVKKYGLDGVQLHGNETPDVCRDVGAKYFSPLRVIKAFNIAESADFAQTKAYESVVDYFLFDTKTPSPSTPQRGKSLYGGSGQKFDWAILNDYQGNTPFLLSGGISVDDAEYIKEITHPLFFGIDINSKFEVEAGVKNIELVKTFFEKIK